MVCAATIAAVCVLGGSALAAAPPRSFGDGLCALASGRCGRPPRFAVLAALPAELAPLLARATVRETLVVGDRVLRVGTLGGAPVVLGLLGIGLVNAEATTRLVLDRFDVAAVIVSGVAGSSARIGDVTVAARWEGDDGSRFDASAALLRGAARAAPRTALARCAPVAPGPVVCLPHQPEVLVGGVGRSEDPFGGRALPCTPGGDDVFGCDPGGAAQSAVARGPSVVDMETAAVARVARAHDVPFVAFRGVSDGAGDPLGLPGFPQQFFAWYRLAAGNAAAAVTRFLGRCAHGGTGRTAAVTARASCGWERRATAVCAPGRAPRALRARVDRACRQLAGGADAAAVAGAWLEAADLASRSGTRRRTGARCARALDAALRDRAGLR